MISLSQLRVEATVDASGFEAGMQKIASSSDKGTAAVEKVGTAIEQTERRLTTSVAGFEKFQRALDPAYRSSVQFETGMRNIQRALDDQKISIERAAELTELLRQRYAQVPTLVNTVTAGVNDNTKAFALNRIGLLELQAAGINSFQALASGMGVVRVATMEGAQVFGAFAQGGLGVTGVLRALVSPIGLTVLGIAALGAGLAIVASRAAENEAALRTFNVALGNTGTATNTTSTGLQQASRQLRDMGVAAKDANAAMAEIARNPLLNPNAAGKFVSIGGDIAARLGQTPDEGVKAFTQAVAGGVDSTLKLGIALRAINVEEATSILAMQRHGQQAEALAKAIDLISRSVDGAHKQSLTPFREETEKLSAAWSGFLDRLSNTAPFKAWEQAMIDSIKSITNFLSTGEGAGGLGTLSKLFSMLPGGQFPAVAAAGIAVAGVANGPPQYGPPIPREFLGNGTAAIPRDPHLEALAPDLSGRLQQMISDAAEKGVTIGIASGLRSTERQDQLWSQALAKYGSEAEARKWVAPPGNSMHERGLAADLSGDLDWAKANAGRYGLTFPLGNEPWHIEPQGARAGLRMPDVDALARASGELERQDERLKRLTPEWQKFGSAQQAGVAAADAYVDVLAKTSNKELASTAAKLAYAEVITRTTAELGKERQVQELTTQGALAEAKAFGVDAVAGYKAAAEAQARVLVLQEPRRTFEQEYQRLLQASAAEALNSAAKAIPALRQQTEANQALAKAAKEGTGAEHDAELQNQATAATHDAVNKALATGNAALVEQARGLTEATLAQIKKNDAAKVALQLQQDSNRDKNSIEVLQLQIGLQGQTSEEIQRQVSLLQEKQRLDALGSSVTQQERADRLAVVDALGRQNIALSEAVRAQQRFDEGIRSAAETVDNTLVTAIQNAFDGKRVTDWGAQLKSMLSSVVSQIANGLLIRPLIGSVLQTFGANPIAGLRGGFQGLST